MIIPLYNEASTVRPTVERLLKVPLCVALEIIVVDDGSTDGGPLTMSDLADRGDIKLVHHDSNRGKGAAIRTGLGAASGDLVTILDADSEYDPSDYNALVAPVVQGQAVVVYGTRSFGSHTAYSFWYVLGNKFLSLWASFLFNTWLSDVETCFKLAPTDVWRSLELRSSGFGIEAEATAKFLKAGHRIYEVPIKYTARRREEGKKLQWTDGVKALLILTRIRLTGYRRRTRPS